MNTFSEICRYDYKIYKNAKDIEFHSDSFLGFPFQLL
jgi:hypothetical protein